MPNPYGLEPQRPTVIVVGAGCDIGKAIAEALLSDGFRVLATYRKAPAGGPAGGDGSSIAYSLDVTDHRGVTDFFRRVEDEFGPPFGVVYVAGCTKEAPISFLTDEAWDEVIGVNLTGAFACLRAASRPMMVGGAGRIVLVGSVSAGVGIPGQAAYAASKAGLEALARVASAEFGRFGISCNVIAPGAIDSGIFRTVADAAVHKILQRTTLRRLGTPAEVAAAVRFLFNPDAGYITGQTLIVDGGISAS
jgi:3-oxoacyl-[acyl-carrier protein] reductase